MQITHLGHACVLVESDGGTRLLLDPGTYSTGFEELTGLTAVAVTHQHPDHVDASRLGALAAANPQAPLLLETETAAALEDDRVGAVTAVTAGQELTVGDRRSGRSAVGTPSTTTRSRRSATSATSSRAMRRTFFHPGDSYDETPTDVDVLGLPLNAPWCRMAETLAFLDAIAPAAVVPIHTGLLNEHGLAGYLMHVDRFGPDGCELVDLRPGSSYDV